MATFHLTVDKSPTPVSSSYIASLDGIRAFSIAIVLLAHSGVSTLIPGGFGVTVFFFLSGFLITTLMTREQDHYGAISLRAFFLRRALRLGPPIFVTLVAATALVLAGLAEGDLSPAAFLSQIFFFYNYYLLTDDSESSVHGLEVLWSLSVEEQFYFIWPIIFIAIAQGRLGIRFILVMLFAILLWRVVRVVLFGASERAIYISTDTRLDSLVYGCLLALLMWRGHAERLFPNAFAIRIPLILGALGLLGVTFLVRDETFRSTLRYTIQGIALMPLFFYAITRPKDPIFAPLNWAPVRIVGVWSYTIYLCHFVIIHALAYNGVAKIGDPAMLVLSVGLSCAFAAVVYRFAEQPAKRLRSKLTGH